ncbi:MAG: aminomethyl-transferring glycine dehydrogenase subunit GcvPA [Hyphomicrobiales bacterium]
MRYLPLTNTDRATMLETVGVRSIKELFAEIPASARLDEPLDGLPTRKSEMEVARVLSRMAASNVTAGDGPFFIGAGAYRHHIPATVDHLIQRSEFLTAYTPYQPELSQGTLQYLFEFQTQIALITGMEVANASMYDGSTGCAEAVLMAGRITKRNKAVLSGGLHAHYRQAVQNVCRFARFDVRALPPSLGAEADITTSIDKETACVLVQTPNVYGAPIDLEPIARAAHDKGALLIAVVTEAVSLGAVRSPGAMGADIVAAEGQSLGVGLNFGGPHLGLFATREAFMRHMPGRLVGETVDRDAKRGYVLTLSTREQHIRRERAKSNICTNSGSCALAFTIHMSLLGEKGFRDLARLNHHNACRLTDRLTAVAGVELMTPVFFNELTIKTPKSGAAVVEALAARGILAGVPVSRLEPQAKAFETLITLATTELNTQDDMEACAQGLDEVLRQ